MPVSPGSEIGQEAGLETPLLSLNDALVSAAYFSSLSHTSIQAATLMHKHWSILTGWPWLLLQDTQYVHFQVYIFILGRP